MARLLLGSIALLAAGCVSEDARFGASATGGGAHGAGGGGTGAQGGSGAGASGGGGGGGGASSLPKPQWAKRFGSSTSGESSPIGLARMDDGSVMLAGDFANDIDLGNGAKVSAGGWDLFVGKFDPAGAVKVAQTYGDLSDMYSFGTASNGTSFGVTGYYEGSPDLGGGALPSPASYLNGFVAVYGADGGHVWSKAIVGTADGGNPEPEVDGIAMNENGDVALTGHFDDTVDFGNGPLTTGGAPAHAFLGVLDGSGGERWSQAFGSPGYYAAGVGVATSTGGDVVYVAGEFADAIDLGGGPLVATGADVFVAAFGTTTGTHQWSQHWVDSGNAYVTVVAADPTGGVVVGGTAACVFDFGSGAVPANAEMYVIKLEASGAFAWHASFDTSAAERQHVTGVTVDAAGNVLATGLFTGKVDFAGVSLTSEGTCASSEFCNDAFLVKLDPNGKLVWARRYGAGGNDFGAGVAFDGPALYWTGRFDDSIDFGDGKVITGNPRSSFIARFSSY